jgi:hypothetical protein
MQIGDLVEFNDRQLLCDGQSGVIIRSQTDRDGTDWFEILSLDELIVVPETLVSLIWSSDQNTSILNKESKNTQKQCNPVQK